MLLTELLRNSQEIYFTLISVTIIIIIIIIIIMIIIIIIIIIMYIGHIQSCVFMLLKGASARAE